MIPNSPSSNSLAPIVSLENVEKSYGAFRAVNNLSFDVFPKEIFGFLGPNGAGKTSTLRMLLDIIQPTKGQVMVLGSNSAISVRHKIGYLPEERGLYRKMKAVDTIAYFARLRGVPGKEAKRRAYELLEEFGLGEFARSKNEAMSKGMAQKVQLLATLAHKPELLILDEPFSGLDPINQHVLEALIRRLRDEGRTVIFSTHVMEHAERLCDRFLILAKGEKRFEGTLHEARDLFPPKLLLRTSDDISPLENAPGILNIVEVSTDQSGEGGPSQPLQSDFAQRDFAQRDFECELERGADVQMILKFAFERGIALTRFEHARTSLHDIFVSLAGDEPHTPGAVHSKKGNRNKEVAA